MKIAIPVGRDKQTVFKRTGKAPFFLIYENQKLIRIVSNSHIEENEELDESEHNHSKDFQKLKGCDIILVQAIGKNVSQALDDIGLKAQKIRKIDGTTADEVIEKILKLQTNTIST